MDGSLMYTKPAPDICASNPGASTENVIAFSGPPLVSSSIIAAAQEGSYCLKSSEPPYILDQSNAFPMDANQVNVTNTSLAGQTVPIVLMNSTQRSSGPSFVYAPSKTKEKGNFKTSALGDSPSCCLNKSDLKHGMNTMPSRRFRHCMQVDASNLNREMLASQFGDFEEERGMRRFEFNLTHLSPELDSTTGTFFETFHSEGTFIQPGILRAPLDIPGTSSTTSSSSGGTGSGMTITTGSSLSSSSRTNFPQIPEKKKKKAVTIGNVFSTMDTFESSRTENDPFDSGSAV